MGCTQQRVERAFSVEKSDKRYLCQSTVATGTSSAAMGDDEHGRLLPQRDAGRASELNKDRRVSHAGERSRPGLRSLWTEEEKMFFLDPSHHKRFLGAPRDTLSRRERIAEKEKKWLKERKTNEVQIGKLRNIVKVQAIHEARATKRLSLPWFTSSQNNIPAKDGGSSGVIGSDYFKEGTEERPWRKIIKMHVGREAHGQMERHRTFKTQSI